MKGEKRYLGKGLHDAEVTHVQKTELACDVHARDPKRNYLEIGLNSEQALFDVGVRAVRFYNCVIVDGELPAVGDWWQEDTLSEQSGKTIVSMRFCGGKKETRLVVRCSTVELLR